MVRIADLPDITSTISCRRTYIARNKINYPKMLPDMVTVMEKIIRFLRKSAFYTYIREKQRRIVFVFIAPAYSKVRYRGSTFRPFVRSSVRPQFMSSCLLCSSDSWEYETLHSNYP